MVTFQLQFYFGKAKWLGEGRLKCRIWRVKTMPLLLQPKTAGWSLQCVDMHYCGEERTSNLFTFLASQGQYTYTNGPKLEHKAWHSLFDFQVHICGELHLCYQKTKSASSLPLIFEIKIFWRVVCSDRTIWNLSALFLGHMQNTSSRQK